MRGLLVGARTIINQKGVADKNRIERDSVSAAQSALVTAQGEVLLVCTMYNTIVVSTLHRVRKRAAVQLRLKIVQDEVKLNATEWMPERIMTPEQLAPRLAPFLYLLVGTAAVSSRYNTSGY